MGLPWPADEHKVEEKLGTEKFNQTSRLRSVSFAISSLSRTSSCRRPASVAGRARRLGQPYLTLYHQHDAADIEVFKAMFDKGMIYRGHKPVHWCKHCHTALRGRD
ncbi:MAG: class I tRNA ligase family protein [Collinsella sp.]